MANLLLNNYKLSAFCFRHGRFSPCATVFRQRRFLTLKGIACTRRKALHTTYNSNAENLLIVPPAKAGNLILAILLAGGESWTRAASQNLSGHGPAEGGERKFCRSAASHAGASKRCYERQDSTGPAKNFDCNKIRALLLLWNG